MSQSYVRQWRHRGSIIRQRGESYQVETSHNGRRSRVTKKTRAEAEAYAAKVADQLRSDGLAAIELSGKERLEAIEALRFFPTHEEREAGREALDILPSRAQREDARQAFDILQGDVDARSLRLPISSPLAEAARFWLRHHPQGSAPVLVQDLLKAYLEAKKHRRPETLREIRGKLGRFCKDFAGVSVVEITSADIDRWLTKNIETLGTKRKYLTLLHAFFEYARKKHGVGGNATCEVYLDNGALDERPPEAYTVGQVQRMLNAAAGDKQTESILPALCIGMFAGLRPAELAALDWKDVDFDEKHIRVRPETAKKRRQRFVDMSDNLIAWLLPYRQKKGPVSPSAAVFRRARAKVLKKAEIGEWLRDGLRHTFGSHHVAAYQDAPSTAFQMGHSNPDLLYKHYRKLVKRSDAEQFWEIRPETTGNIIAFAATA